VPLLFPEVDILMSLVENFDNADEFHDFNFWWGHGPLNAALFEIWCHEDGPDGKLPKPDEWQGDWHSNACDLYQSMNAYSFRLSRWWWIAVSTPLKFSTTRHSSMQNRNATTQ